MNTRAISLTLASFVLLACVSTDSSMSDDTISFSTAQAEVELQLKAGRSESACYKVASDVKAEVTTACSNAQKMVNRINTGSSCCKTNAGAVTQAGSRLKEVQGKVDKCKSALRDVQDTKVSFPAVSFKKLKKGKCASFFGGNSYKNAKRKFVNQKRKCNGLQGQVKAFKKGASDAKKAQKRAIQKCLNRRHRTISSTYNTAKKQCNSSANKKTWKRAKHMLCVLKKTPLNKCKVGALPSITKPKTARVNCKGQKFSHGAAQALSRADRIRLARKKKNEKDCHGINYKGKKCLVSVRISGPSIAANILKACATKKMIPLCNYYNWADGKCWTTRKSKFFSDPPQAKKLLPNDYKKLAGYAFYAPTIHTGFVTGKSLINTGQKHRWSESGDKNLLTLCTSGRPSKKNSRV